MRHRVLIIAISLVSSSSSWPALTAELPTSPNTPPWQAIVVGHPAISEQLAIVDLQRYLAQVTGEVPGILAPSEWKKQPRPAIIAGNPSTNDLLAATPLKDTTLSDQGYLLAHARLEHTDVVCVMGRTPIGTVNAIYGLLRELGYAFFLGSEALPTSLPNRLPLSPVIRNPALAVRGVLPWYNFFNSPTTWDPIDHRAFADQLIRSGANFVGFHTYDQEPFAAYEEGGRMKWGGRLLNTRQPTWGTHPMPAKDFAFDTDKMFADDYFGAASTHTASDADTAIRLEQNILRDALDYAAKRGLKTCLGFEMNGDPTQPSDREVFLKRINRILDQYPSLDYLWIWQPETQGAQGYAASYNQHILRDTLTPGSSLEAYGIARRPVFKRIVERTTGERPFFQDNETGRTARALEGARLEQFARLALRAINRRLNPPRLVISGWGGDERLLSAEYYEGLDKLLPSDVVFSSLDHIWPRTRVDTVYHDLPPARQRWPIPWLELDGDQWHPQPWVHPYEQMMHDVHRGGSQGILGIHWRTRDIEENFAFLVDSAWQPGLTSGEFFARLAQRCYPPRIAPDMAIIHSELDRLGYRWVGGAGQAECGTFDWGPGTKEKADALERLGHWLDRIRQKAGTDSPRLDSLRNRIDWVLRFREAETAAVRARELLRAQKPAEALELLDRGDLARAIRIYARGISTRGEYGVLATLNTKAVVAWRSLREQCLKQHAPTRPQATPTESESSHIVLPRFHGSVPAGQDVVFMPICLNGRKAWMHYRTLGQPAWNTRALVPVRGWVFQATIAAIEVRPPGLEVAFSWHESPLEPMAQGPFDITVMPPIAVNTTPRKRIAGDERTELRATVSHQATIPFEVRWNDLPRADWYRVFRDGSAVTDTAIEFFPDAPTSPAAQHVYTVEAHQDNKVLAQATVPCPSPDQPVSETFTVRWMPTRNGVLLTWPPLVSQHVAMWRIRVASRESGDAPGNVVSETPARRSGDHRCSIPLTPGRWACRIISVNQAGREGSPVMVAVDWPITLKTRTLHLPLTTLPAKGRREGAVAFEPNGARFTDGWIEVPHDPLMEMQHGMTLEFEFQADDVGRMPVILSHGQWQAAGWFVQILGGRLIIRTPQGDASGPAINKGTWYAVQWDYDGDRHRLRVNGQEAQPLQPIPPAPTQCVLRIGQYQQVGPDFQFVGRIRNVRISGPEIAGH